MKLKLSFQVPFCDISCIMSASDSPSNVLREAQNLGVKVISEKTFLTFDRSICNVTQTESPGAGAYYHNRRRFTTTDIILNKELMDQLAVIGNSQPDFLERIDIQEEVRLTGNGYTDDDVRRSSMCSDLTDEFDSYTKNLQSRKTSVLGTLLSQTPIASSAVMMGAFDDNNTPSSTTVMIRNIPNRYTQDSLISVIKSLGFNFNFFYCPIDRHSRANCGYFFVNLLTNDMAKNFMVAFHGLQLPAFRSHKVCEARWARVQGYSANVDQYRESSLVQLPREFRPRIFKPDGTEVPIGHNDKKVDELKMRKVFVGGLSPVTEAETIREHLSQFGEVEDVSIIIDSDKRASRGFAFVTFAKLESVTLCVDTKEAHFIEGRSVGIRHYSQSTQVGNTGSMLRGPCQLRR
jgi:RNA recognition motif-containing protein